MVKMILQKSEENEEEEAKKEDLRKQARIAAREGHSESEKDAKKPMNDDLEDSDLEVIDDAESSDDEEDARTTTTASFVKVKHEEKKVDDIIPEEEEDEPDVYDVNVLAWDTQCSPLHLAILNGHIDVVKELVQTFGADILLPIKLLNDYDKTPRGAILTLVLALNLPMEKAKAMTRALLDLGASSAQADTHQTTALHYISGQKPELIETLFEFDEPAAKRAINHLSVTGSSWSPSAWSPLMSAINKGNALAALKLLAAGAVPEIDFKQWLKSVEAQYSEVSRRDSERNKSDFERDTEQPIVLAIQSELPQVALGLLEKGADPNTLPKQTRQGLRETWYRNYNQMKSVLDVVRDKIKELKEYKEGYEPTKPDLRVKDDVDYLQGLERGTYKYFIAQVQLDNARETDKQSLKTYEGQMKNFLERGGMSEKKEAVLAMAKEFENVEEALIQKGAKTFKELHPDVEQGQQRPPYEPYVQPPPKPFEVTFDFSAHDMTDETREGYLQL